MAQYSGRFNTTTQVWDTSQVEKAGIKDPALKELMIRLYQNLNRMSTSLGQSDTGEYALFESLNGQKWFANPVLNSTSTTNPAQRQVFRKVFNLGTVSGVGVHPFPHGITVTQSTTFTRIYGCMSNTTALRYIPLPYVNPIGAGNDIGIEVNAISIFISTAQDYSAFDKVYVVLEWIQS